MLEIKTDDKENELEKPVQVRYCPNVLCHDSGNLKVHRNFEYIYCKGCGMRGPYFDGHLNDAVNAWNLLKR